MVQRDPELLENDTDKIRKLLLDNALARSKAPNKEIAGAASLAEARLYLSFPAAALIKDQAENYFNALICAGQVYSNKGAIYEAIILLAQAFKLKEKSRGIEWKEDRKSVV